AVVGRRPEALAVVAEGGEDLPLRAMAVEHRALAIAKCRIVLHGDGRAALVEELARDEAPAARVVRSHLHEARVDAASFERGAARECGRVVVRVTAFV